MAGANAVIIQEETDTAPLSNKVFQNRRHDLVRHHAGGGNGNIGDCR